VDVVPLVRCLGNQGNCLEEKLKYYFGII